MRLEYIIIHKDQYDKLHTNQFKINDKTIKNGNKIIEDLNRNNNLKLIKKFGDTYIYTYNFKK